MPGTWKEPKAGLSSAAPCGVCRAAGQTGQTSGEQGNGDKTRETQAVEHASEEEIPKQQLTPFLVASRGPI